MKKEYDLNVYERYNRIVFKIDFVWGQVKQIHKIGDNEIIEYYNHKDDKVNYHVENTHASYETLDKALIGALAHKYDGCNTRADEMIFRMLRME
jgi:hypothetical protein